MGTLIYFTGALLVGWLIGVTCVLLNLHSLARTNWSLTSSLRDHLYATDSQLDIVLGDGEKPGRLDGHDHEIGEHERRLRNIENHLWQHGPTTNSRFTGRQR